MTRYRSTFDTPEQALAEALLLGLMAPGDSEARACAMLAEELEAGGRNQRSLDGSHDAENDSAPEKQTAQEADE